MNNFEELKDFIIKNNSFILTTHVNPDADAIGSEIAMYNLLKKLNKEVYIINHSVTPYNLKFLDSKNLISHFSSVEHSYLFNSVDAFIALDFNRVDRTVSMKQCIENFNGSKACIDHHLDPQTFADVLISNIQYSATGEIIYDFIKKTNIVELDYSIALPIYAAIMTDTGSFRFDRTTPKLHRIAAELLELGVIPNQVHDQIYDQSPLSKVKLLAKTLDSLTIHGANDSIAYMTITQKMFEETGALESDTDTFVNYGMAVSSVKIGILFIELKQGIKVSFRSKGSIPVNKLAEEFNGGGHLNASGARMFNANLKEYIPLILKSAEKFIG